MLPKSKASTAPSEDRSSSARRRARRSSRSRSKSTRASQSTPMLPRVAMLIVLLHFFSFGCGCRGSGDAPAAVDVEAVRRDPAVEQEELRRVYDVCHRRQLAAGRAALVAAEHTLGLGRPERAVAD